MTRVYGAETADRETDADERYLAEVVQVLSGKGYQARPVLLYGPDRAAKLIRQLKASRWTSWSSARTATGWSATCSSARPSTRSATA